MHKPLQHKRYNALLVTLICYGFPLGVVVGFVALVTSFLI